jgi:hypothetical protein
MEEHGACPSGVCPEASANGESVSRSVPHNPPVTLAHARLAVGRPLRGPGAPWAAGG